MKVIPEPALTEEAAAAAKADAAATAQGLHHISPRLYNQDLAPTKREGRKWTSYSIF